MSDDRQRLELTLIGGVAGVAAWGIYYLMKTGVLTERPALVAVLSVGGFFWTVMAVTGPLPLRKALPVAAAVTVPTVVLTLWASFRFDDVSRFFGTGHPDAAVFVLLTLPLPFFIAELSGRGWLSYPALFDEAWALFSRSVSAGLFTGLFWLVLLLSSELLGLVHLDFMDVLLHSPFLVLVLSGGTAGLGLAVAGEHSFEVLPRLGVRLVRLLLPLMLVIVAIFLAAAAGQGLRGLFGSFSAAATLMAVTFAAATFVTATLDREDSEATRSAILKLSAQAMSVLMAGVAGLAAWALWLRVSDHGWTPDRLAAATLELAALAYALGYLAAIVLGRGWMERIRQANLMIALGLIAVAALWLTPVINPQRISVENQLARFGSGKVGLADLDIWTVTRRWGRAGSDVPERLLALAPEADRPALRARLERAKSARSIYDLNRQDAAVSARASREDLADRLKVLPTHRAITPGELENLSDFVVTSLARSCASQTPGGNPSCIAVQADFWPDRPGDELMVLYRPPGVASTFAYVTSRDGSEMTSAQVDGEQGGPGVIDALLSGSYRVAPERRNILYIGETTVSP